MHILREGGAFIFNWLGFKHDMLISELLNCVSVKYKPVYDVSVIVLPVDMTVITQVEVLCCIRFYNLSA